MRTLCFSDAVGPERPVSAYGPFTHTHEMNRLRGEF